MSENTPKSYNLDDLSPSQKQVEVARLDSQAELFQERELALLQALGLPRNGTVLDFGCGTGSTAKRIARECPQLVVTGIDICDDMLKIAQSSITDCHNNRQFLKADVCNTGLAEESFSHNILEQK